MHSHSLTRRQYCDLELILNGGFYPLSGFLSQKDYDNVLVNCCLSSGAIWPIPVVLDVSLLFAKNISINDDILLRDQEGCIIAKMQVTDLWQPDKAIEALAIYGTKEVSHPGVDYLFHRTESVYLGGPITLVNLPRHFDYVYLRHSPLQLKNYFKDHHFNRVVGFQTRNPMHRAHYELTQRAAIETNTHLLIHPSVGETKMDDVDVNTRIQCYRALMAYYVPNTATLSLLPLAMRMAGPREALWHAIIRKNYGCTHFIIGRDHAGSGNFYDPYDAQKFAKKFEDHIGINIVTLDALFYVKNKNQYLSKTEIEADPTISKTDVCSISGTELRQFLKNQQSIPSWFSFPEILNILRKAYLPNTQQGFTLFFTGLPSSGKSTLANAVSARLMEMTNRTISVLDGDLFRKISSHPNAFSKNDRDNNIKQIGLVASEITKHRGIAICACIAPYEETRTWVRNLVKQYGGFIEIYVSTPLSVCEKRDPKGNYEKARLNIIQNFTGISDPYNTPTDPEIVMDTSLFSIMECVDKIINFLEKLNYLEASSGSKKPRVALLTKA